MDTNVLVSSVGMVGKDLAKAKRAQAILRRQTYQLSTQVLGEFYHAATHRRRKVPLSHAEALVWVQYFKRHKVHEITLAHVDLALEISGRFQASYDDALILAAARLARCPTMNSEDLSHGQDYDGLRVINPFLPDLAPTA